MKAVEKRKKRKNSKKIWGFTDTIVSLGCLEQARVLLNTCLSCYLEGQGDLVSIPRTSISHSHRPVIPIINLLTY